MVAESVPETTCWVTVAVPGAVGMRSSERVSRLVPPRSSRRGSGGGAFDEAVDEVARDLPGRGVEAVERVDRGDRHHQGCQLGLGVVAGSLVPDLVGHGVRPVRQPGGGLGERERRAFGVVEVRRLAPRGDEVDALAALTEVLELARV
jgi:hypothetical protein